MLTAMSVKPFVCLKYCITKLYFVVFASMLRSRSLSENLDRSKITEYKLGLLNETNKFHYLTIQYAQIILFMKIAMDS